MRRIPILLYHRVVGPGGRSDAFSVTASRFENHMSRLSTSGWRTVSLPDWFEHHQKNKVLPDRSFVLTFDDGHLDNRTEALPILRRFGFSATIFLAVNAVDRQT
jgi:peptidoglycan/xylan/chitin deacetylase (PgdA/CDA1 family)